MHLKSLISLFLTVASATSTVAGQYSKGVVLTSASGEILNAHDNSVNEELTSAGKVQNEGFSSNQDPAIYQDKFGIPMKYAWSELPMAAKLKSGPWSGSYWPMYQDSINFRYAGNDTLSPVEKYETAFGVKGLKEAVSLTMGQNSPAATHNAKTCSTDADCGDKGVACAQPKGICVPKWFGICHAWSAASISEPEPVKAVQVNDVIFDVNDIKALVSTMYNMAFDNVLDIKLIGNRCDDYVKDDLVKDQFGRILDSRCRGLNAGAFHLSMTNFIGLNQMTFFFNRELGHEVWNQPLVEYSVNSAVPISKAKAMEILGVLRESDATFSEKTDHFRYVKAVIYYARETNPEKVRGPKNEYEPIPLEYILEFDSNDNIVGGEWTGKSLLNHPAFLTVVSKRTTSDTQLFNGLLSWTRVRKLLKVSVLGKDDSVN